MSDIEHIDKLPPVGALHNRAGEMPLVLVEQGELEVSTLKKHGARGPVWSMGEEPLRRRFS